ILLKGNSIIDLNNINSISKIDSLYLSIKIYNSIVEDKNGKLISTSRSDFPNIKFENIDNFILKSNKHKNKKFGVSCFIGPTYDFKNNINIGVGIGLTYDIINF
ncbi:MAG: hypothetical protein RSC92_02755, partial [Clostridia bacterium]